MADSYDFERLLEELAAAPTYAEACVVYRQFQMRFGADALSEQQIQQVTDIIRDKPA